MARSARTPSPQQVARSLAAALRHRGVRFRYVRPVAFRGWAADPPTGFYVIGGRSYAPYEAANAFLPGGWPAFYAHVTRRR